MRGVLGLKRKKPAWFDLPVMMKLTLSTPHHALKNLAKGPLTRPNNFMMIPQMQPVRMSARGRSKQIHADHPVLVRTRRVDAVEMHQHPRSAIASVRTHERIRWPRELLTKNFFMLLESYQNHPEAKSLGPDGKPCEFDTRGFLQRAHIVANWPPIYIGKESDKHWEEGEDLSLLDFKAVEYKRKGNAVATDEQLAQIAKVPKREFMRRGVNQHTLEKICQQQPVRTSRLAKCLRVLEEYQAATNNLAIEHDD